MDTVITLDGEAIFNIVLAILAGAAAVVAAVVGFIGFVWNRLDNSIKELKSELTAKIERLDDRVHQQIFSLTSRVDELFKNGNLGGHSSDITQGGNSEMGASSPLTLTALGNNIAQMINAQEMVDKYADRVLVAEDACELDIQDACFSFARNDMKYLVNQQEKAAIKSAIYEYGAGNPTTVYNVLGILLRDYHLGQRGFEVPVRRVEEGQTPPPNHPQTSL